MKDKTQNQQVVRDQAKSFHQDKVFNKNLNQDKVIHHIISVQITDNER